MSYDVLIIGAGPAGLSAAINVRARGRSVLVVSSPMEDNPLWRTELVDNYPGLPGISGPELLKTLRAHAEKAGAEFRQGRVVSTLPMKDSWMVSIDSDAESAKAVILAAGVVRGKKFPGEEMFLGRGVSYCATCDGMLYRGRNVAVMGFSESAEKEAEFLRSIGCAVTYFHRPKVCSIEGTDHVTAVTCDGTTIPADGVFLLRPALAPTDLFPSLSLKNGFVAVDRRMSTNLPGLFAAGDCTGTPLQVAKAVGEGLIAGQSAAAYAAKAI